MKPVRTKTEIPGAEPKTDTARDDEKARIADADKIDVADRDRVHGGGSRLGLDEK